MTTTAEDRRANARLIASLLGGCGLALALGSLVALGGWLPFSRPASRALALVLGVTAGVDLLAALFFMTRSTQ